MSRNENRIKKALAAKGYRPIYMAWTPVGHACEMCGPEGGWYITYGIIDEEDDDAAYIDVLLAYSTDEAIEEIENMMPYTEQEAHDEHR